MINHGNLEIATVPLPSLDTLRLLYFGFIYRGKAPRDLLEALADLFASAPEMRQRAPDPGRRHRRGMAARGGNCSTS